MDAIVVPRQQCVGLTEATEGPPPPPLRSLVPHVWNPYAVEYPLRVPRFRVHGVHNAPGVRGALLAFVGRLLSLYAAGRWGFPLDCGFALEYEKEGEISPVLPESCGGNIGPPKYNGYSSKALCLILDVVKQAEISCERRSSIQVTI